MNYAALKQSLGLKTTAIDTGFKADKPDVLEPEILPTFQPGTKASPNRAEKPKLPPEDLSHLNAPHTERLQKMVKLKWASMSPEERAAASATRRQNAKKATGHKRIQH